LIRVRVLALALAISAAPAAGEALFNGRTLDGWEVMPVAANGSATPMDKIFVADRGVIRVYPGAPDGSAQPHAVLATKRSWSRYRMGFDYRFTGTTYAANRGLPRDTGLLLHIVPERPGLVATWHRWPPSLEYQIMEGSTGDAFLLKSRAQGRIGKDGGYAVGVQPKTAKLIRREIESFRLPRARSAKERAGWNRVVVEVDGDRARFWLNGQLVNAVAEVAEDRAQRVPMVSGRIGLQAESAGAEFRRITIDPLPKTTRSNSQ
jgi:hypothetical protein